MTTTPNSRQIIFITGICGSGKSTTAQQVSCYLKNQGYNVRWLHEECRNNPLRRTKKSFKKSGCKSIWKYIDASLQVYSEFVSKISNDSYFYVIDGYIFQSTVLNLFNGGFPEKIIKEYFELLCTSIKPVNPLIINLYKKDLAKSFDNVWRERGTRWKKISIDIPQSLPEEEIDYYEYQKKGVLEWHKFRLLNTRLLKDSDLRYLQIDTSENKWNDYYDEIFESMGFIYSPRKPVVVENLANYCGEYAQRDIPSEGILIKEIDEKLYCEIFFPFMRLIPLTSIDFYIRGLPIVLRFAKDSRGEIVSFRFLDDYHWTLTGKVYERKVLEDTI